MVYNCDINEEENRDRRGVDYVKNTINEIYSFLDCRDVHEAEHKVLQLVNDIRLAVTLTRLGIGKDACIKVILDNIDSERRMNNPRKCQKKSRKYPERGVILSGAIKRF